MRRLTEAMAAYDAALKLDPSNETVRRSLDGCIKLIEEQASGVAPK